VDGSAGRGTAAGRPATPIPGRYRLLEGHGRADADADAEGAVDGSGNGAFSGQYG
jgi:hypothetical protein